ncbi:MAG: metal-dependent hydrolase [Peptococcaceae bacterium]|nr:metal-dependent hydrolase [Peptococcaceae bacterium]
MLILAHVGITAGLARAVENIVNRVNRGNHGFKFDYRLIVLGSMLPDIIDKPLGGVVLREMLGNGRIYSHTLLFSLFLLGAGMFLRRKSRRSLCLALAGGGLAHQVLDGMWLQPETFLWPAYGWGFPKESSAEWLRRWVESLQTDPMVYVPEIIGGLIILYFAADLIFRVKAKEFVQTGRLGDLHEV